MTMAGDPISSLASALDRYVTATDAVKAASEELKAEPAPQYPLPPLVPPPGA